MKVVFLLEAGIPSYRNFLFSFLDDHPAVTDLLVIHTGKIYDNKVGDYKDKRVRFIGSNKLGFHIGFWRYLLQADVIISSYNLRIITCWLPCFFLGKKMIFWGKGLGDVESKLVVWLRKWTANRVKYLLVYNDKKKEEIVNKLQISDCKVIAYQNTVRIENPQNFGTEKKSYFLYFGRIQERKGLIGLIDAYKEYVDCVGTPKYRLRFVGNGAFKESLIERANELNVGKHIEFFPAVYDDVSISDHFKLAKCYVSPFNVGLAVINSFSYGVPVITCKKPQVGPEFYYMNSKNAIVLDDISDLAPVFNKLENEAIVDSEEVYQFYIDNLHYSVMQRNFIETIIKVRGDE